VDAGRAKAKVLDAAAGVHQFDVRWISQASASQRAGRAGRTGPGHCYRLFSSAVFNDLFPEFTAPEIANTALEGVVLLMHALGLPKVRVTFWSMRHASMLLVTSQHSGGPSGAGGKKRMRDVRTG
jgi:HrpA-like RNA helicase